MNDSGASPSAGERTLKPSPAAAVSKGAGGDCAPASRLGRHLCLLMALGWCGVLAWIWIGSPWPIRLVGAAAAALGIVRPAWFFGALALSIPLFGNQPGSGPSLIALEMGLIGPIIHDRLRRALGLVAPRTNGLDPWLLLFVGYSWITVLLAWRYLHCEFRVEGMRFLYANVMHYGTSQTFGFQAALKLTIGLGLYQMLRDGPWAAERARRFLLLALAGLALDSVLGLLHYRGLMSLEWWRADNPDLQRFSFRRLQTLWGHPGWFAQYLAMLAPAALGMGLASPSVRWRWVGWFLAVALVPVQLLTMQRAGWLALGAAYAAVLGVALLKSDREGGWKRPVLGAGAFVALVVVCGVALAALVPDFRDRFEAFFVYQDRTRIWESAYALAKGDWLTGIGLGNYYTVHTRHYLPGHAFFMLDKVTAHNLYLHVWTERGVIGLGLLAAVFAAAGAMLARRNGAKSGAGIAPDLRLAAVGGLTAFAVDGFFQYVFYVRVVELSFWVFLAMAAWNRPAGTRCGGGRRRRWITAIAMLVLAVTFYWKTHREYVPWRMGVEQWNFLVGGRQTSLSVPAEARRVRLSLAAIFPGMEVHPQEITIAMGGRTLGKAVFSASGAKHVELDLPGEAMAGRWLELTASRVWSPLRDSGLREPPVHEVGVLYLPLETLPPGGGSSP
jgi:O-antigen ligase